MPLRILEIMTSFKVYANDVDYGRGLFSLVVTKWNTPPVGDPEETGTSVMIGILSETFVGRRKVRLG